MPRRHRLRITGVPQHIVRRGNNRQVTFFTEEDYAFYLRCVHEAASRHGCAINAYVLMANHVHLLATPRHPDTLSLMMRDAGRRYAQYVNFNYRRTGTLWEGPLKVSLVDTEVYFFRCCRYIECNPVRAGLVAHPRDYRWSSYRCNAEGAPDTMITAHEQYERLGSSAAARQNAYRDLFRGELDPGTLAEIRNTVNRGWPLGAESFKDQIAAALQCQVRPAKRGRPSMVSRPVA